MQLSWLLPITCSKLSDFFDRENSKSLFKEISWDKAFKVIEMELGFMYDRSEERRVGKECA